MKTQSIRNFRSIKLKRPQDREILEKVSHSIGMAEALSEPLWLGDEKHRTIYVNPMWEALTGYTLDEYIGRPADWCFDEKSKKIIAEQHKLRTKGQSSKYEGIMTSKSGEKIPILISGSPTSAGGTIGLWIDLRKSKRLAHQERIARQIMRHSAEAFVILSKGRKIKLWNHAAEKMFGYKEEEVLKKSIDIIIPKDQSASNKGLIAEVGKKKHLKNAELTRQTKSGELIEVSASITKVVSNNSNFIGYLIIYRDITQQKRTHTELQKRFEAIQDAYKELGLQRRHLDYMYEIVDTAVSDCSLADLEKLIVSAMCLLTKSDGTVLRLYDEKRKVLKLKACFGVSQKWWDKSQISFENSIAQEAIENKRAIIIDDIDSFSKHQGVKLLKAHKYKTLILIPLMMGDTIIGSLSLYTSDPAKFRLIETDFLENMGKQCSIALCSKSAHSK